VIFIPLNVLRVWVAVVLKELCLPLHNSGAMPPVHELFKRPSYFSNIRLMSFSHPLLGLPSCLLPRVLHSKISECIQCFPIQATSPAHRNNVVSIALQEQLCHVDSLHAKSSHSQITSSPLSTNISLSSLSLYTCISFLSFIQMYHIIELISWSRVLFEKLTVAQLLELANGLYSETHESSPHHHNLLLYDLL
jgi:hypothetical protein